MEGSVEKCEAFKEKGNNLLKESKIQNAIDAYTNAIDTASSQAKFPSDKLAVYYSNRAFCHLKNESYGLALNDAQQSIKLNPSYTKAYYRAGSAYLVLSRNKQAYDAFKQAFKLSGNKDEFIYQKLKTLKQIVDTEQKQKRMKIFQGLEGYHKQNQLVTDWRQIQVTQYDGPSLQQKQTPTLQWCMKLMQYFKDQKKLHKKYALQLIQIVTATLQKYKTLVEYNIEPEEEFTVCGDIHGQYYDLANIFKVNGFPALNNKYLFNGDFVDRGSFSVECILTLVAWKSANPQILHMTRGNHEARTVNMIYGFKGQVQAKYGLDVYEAFCKLFCALPLAYTINSKVMICHGGLFSQDGVTLEDIKKVDRFREPPEKGIMCDLLWADPMAKQGRQPSKRGVSMGFGPDITNKFFAQNKLQLLIRSHEMKQQGYQQAHNGKCITIFSAPNYCDQMGNKGAFIRLKGSQLKAKFTQFSAVPHPNIRPMAYAKTYGGLF